MTTRRLIPISNALGNVMKRSAYGTAEVPSAMDAKFTLLTYNMLSPHYMWPQVYTYVPDKYKDWNYRHKLLERELMETYRADIMCMQEMTHLDYLEFWKTTMKSRLQYGSKFVAKKPPKYWKGAEQDMDGVSIFYNLQKFDYLSSTSLYLDDVLGTFAPKEIKYLKNTTLNLTDGSGKHTGQMSLYDVLTARNQVCLFVTLKHKQTGNVFIVINTHLYWKYDEVKLTQCMIIMRKLSHIINELLVYANDAASSNDVKILFTGDLNSTRDSLVIKFLKGHIVAHGDLNVINPMKTYLNHCFYDDVPENMFVNTCYSGKLKGIFDYMWYHDTDFALTKVLSGAEVSRELETAHEFGLPNKNHPSDHIPLLAEFQIL